MAVGFTVVALILYLIAILFYAGSGKSNVEGQVPLAVDNGVNVTMEIASMDPTKNLAVFRIVVFPAGDYADTLDATSGGLTFAKSVKVTLWDQVAGSISRVIPVGEVVGARDSVMYVSGDDSYYPFDHYSPGLLGGDADQVAPEEIGSLINPATGKIAVPFMTVEPVDDAGKPTTNPDGLAFVPIGIGDAWKPSRLQGWTQQWDVSITRPNQIEGLVPSLAVDLTVKRSGGVKAFALTILALMIALAVVATMVASRVSTRKRRIEATMASWFGAMLFALIPLRNFLPGAPPIGAWIDVLVFFWVVGILMVSMCIFVGSWVRYSAPPKIAPKEDGGYNLP